MGIVMFLLLCAFALAKSGLQLYLAQTADYTQFICLSTMSTPVDGLELLKAFLCGKPLNNGPLQDLWMQTGLYHLLVVSGGHLVLLEWALAAAENFFRRRQILPKTLVSVISVLILLGFTLMTGFQAPLVRALIARGLGFSSEYLRLNWTASQLVTISGMLCLVLSPAWLTSRSLLMSWLAALALTTARSALGKSLAVFLFMIPCLWGWGQVHPLGILINLLVAEPVAILLTLATLTYFIFPPLSEGLLAGIIKILQTMAELTPLSNRNSQALPLLTVWAFLIIITAILQGRFISQRRSQWHFESV
jgi:competence protein ComEC